MKTFKEFLAEAAENAVKPKRVTKARARRVWQLTKKAQSDEELQKILKTYKMSDIVENGPFLYRGDRKIQIGHGAIIDTRNMRRVSVDSVTNAYMVCFDKMLEDAGFAPRSKSLIVTNSYSTADNYASSHLDIYAVFPIPGKSRLFSSAHPDLLIAEISSQFANKKFVPFTSAKSADAFILGSTIISSMDPALNPFMTHGTRAEQHQVLSYDELVTAWTNSFKQNQAQVLASIWAETGQLGIIGRQTDNFDDVFLLLEEISRNDADFFNKHYGKRILVATQKLVNKLLEIRKLRNDRDKLEEELKKSGIDVIIGSFEANLEMINLLVDIRRKNDEGLKELTTGGNIVVPDNQLRQIQNIFDYHMSDMFTPKLRIFLEGHLAALKTFKVEGIAEYFKELTDKFFVIDNFGIKELVVNDDTKEYISPSAKEMWISGKALIIPMSYFSDKED